jgi:hypothetical protein
MIGDNRAPLRALVAVLLAALVVGPLKVPQPFLAILLTQMLIAFPACDGISVARRLAGAAGGSITGLLILSLAPNEQWISLPLFFAAMGIGTRLLGDRWGKACAILFGMGLASMFAEAFVYPARDLPFGLAHGVSVCTAVIATAIASALIGFAPGPPAPPAGAESILPIGLATCGALVAACALLPTELTVTVGSSCATALTIAGKPSLIRPKFLGGLLGIGAAFLFLAAIMDFGNAFGLYLAGLCGGVALFEWLAEKNGGYAPVLRQAGAMFAVVATILPEPRIEITGSIERMVAVLLGLTCGAAACFFQSSSKEPLAPATIDPRQ